MTDVLAYLRSKDLDLREAPNLNVRTTCFFHGEEGDAKTGRLYIKIDPGAEVPGLFFCFRCEQSGTLKDLKRYFGDPLEEGDIDLATRIEILNAAAEYYHSNIDKETLSYLTGPERGLSVEAVERFRIGTTTGGLGEFLLANEFKLKDIKATGLVYDSGEDFFPPGIVTIPYYDGGQCVQIRGRDRNATKNKYRTPTSQESLLFNTDTLLNSDGAVEVVLTEGEFDAIILEDRGISAIGIPGARMFKEEWNQFFSLARRVYICFDNDGPGSEASDRLSTILGARSRIVEIPKEFPKDVTDFFTKWGHSTSDFEYLMRKANPGIIVRVEDAFEAWLDREGNPELKGLRTGYEKLDAAFRPGLLPGQVMVFLARTGTGKTIMMVNFMQRMITVKPDIKILFVSLEQTRNEWFERARRVHGFYNTHLDPLSELNQETINFYKDNLLIVDKNRVTAEDLKVCIRQSQDELEAKLDMVIVDYLGYFARGFRGEPYVRTSDAVMALKGAGKEEDVVIMAPHQVNRMSTPGTFIKSNDARESGVVEETADLLIGLNNGDKDPGKTVTEATGDIRLQILKSRHGGDQTEIEIQWAPISLAMVPQVDDVFPDKFLRQARDEINWRRTGEYDFASVMRRHATGNRAI